VRHVQDPELAVQGPGLDGLGRNGGPCSSTTFLEDAKANSNFNSQAILLNTRLPLF
jgi:hypothetical protein